MWNLARCTFALLIASFVLAHGASAVMEEDGESEFVRTGFYLGAGGSAAFPNNWNKDFDNDLNEKATDLANGLKVTVDGADLENAQFGVNGVIGYRAGALVAFEVEGEWLISSNKTDLNVNNSTGSHTAEVDEIWTLTANVKVYPPFTGWLKPFARFQPFAKVGLGVQHSKLDTDIATSGLTTDFQIKKTTTKLDGALRFGGGIDIYATRNIVCELNATYVVPFAELGSTTREGRGGTVNADYVSVQWRLVYRF